MEKFKILVVDDERIIRESLYSWLSEVGYQVYTAADAKEALNIIEKEGLNIVISDLKMPDVDGIELMRRAKKINPFVAFIFITAYASVESAVIAMKEGAYDYIEKPFCPEKIELQIKKLIEHQSLLFENINLKKELSKKYSFEDIIGKSHKMQEIFNLIQTVAKSDATILIQGDTGTGKELVARAIHNTSLRKNAPFVAVSCAALPESLLETELFGHEKGSFTGAIYQREGKFELANKGTLFLDEIGEISPSVQLHLLRVIQEKEFTRIGGNISIKVDIRVISATNKDLSKIVSEDKFREDLYYRLNVIVITLPSLRERREDIPLLAEHFLKKFNNRNQKNISGFEEKVIEFFMKYNWPGNVRELENFVEHAVVVCKSEVIKLEDLPNIRSKEEIEYIKQKKTMEEIEKEYIIKTLIETKQNLSKTAEILGITRATLYNKIKKYQIDRHFDNIL